jgi:hypothetical protein
MNKEANKEISKEHTRFSLFINPFLCIERIGASRIVLCGTQHNTKKRMTPRQRVFVVGLLLVVAASAGTIPLTPAHWNVLYDGYGEVPFCKLFIYFCIFMFFCYFCKWKINK